MDIGIERLFEEPLTVWGLDMSMSLLERNYKVKIYKVLSISFSYS